MTNKGTTDRIHLVVDCKVNDWLTQVFEQGEKNIVPDTNREELLKVIAELRSQQTETGDKLAMQLEQSL